MRAVPEAPGTTGEDVPADGPSWGREVVVDDSGPHPVRVYRERRRLLPELLVDCRRWGDRECLVHGTTRLTFAQLESAVERVAAALVDRGLGGGDAVLLYAANSVEWVVTYWAVLRAGGVVVLGNGWWSATEVAAALRTVEPTLVFADDRRAERLPAGCPTLPDTEVRAAMAAEPGPDAPRLDPPEGRETDPAVVIFTSGTTGAPKGAVLPHRAPIANLHNLLNLTRRLPGDIPDDHPRAVNLHTLPLFHVGGLQALGMSLMTGATMVFLDGRFDPERVLEIIEGERVTHWACVPTMLARVVAHLERPDAPARDTGGLRSLTAGGSAVPEELGRRSAAVFPNMAKGMAAVYGLTEAGGTVSTASGRDLLGHPGTVGRPVPVAEVRLGAPDGPDALGGEIQVRSPGVMLGYWGAPDGGGEVDAEGWLGTGDLGRLDDEGWLYLVGRAKDVIIRGGENVAAAHVEDRLRAHPAVAEVAVVGLAHPDLGEEVAAAVVPVPGVPADPGELAAFAAEELARFAVPSRWWVRAEPLPTNAVGKVVKRELVAGWPAEGADAGGGNDGG